MYIVSGVVDRGKPSQFFFHFHEFLDSSTKGAGMVKQSGWGSGNKTESSYNC